MTSLIRSSGCRISAVWVASRIGVSGTIGAGSRADIVDVDVTSGSCWTAIDGPITPLSSNVIVTSASAPKFSVGTVDMVCSCFLGPGVENPPKGAIDEGRSAGPRPSSANNASARAFASADIAGTLDPDAVWKELIPGTVL